MGRDVEYNKISDLDSGEDHADLRIQLRFLQNVLRTSATHDGGWAQAQVSRVWIVADRAKVERVCGGVGYGRKVGE